MNKKENKIDFDLSTLSLSSLIEVYDAIDSFILSLEERKLVEEEQKEEDNE